MKTALIFTGGTIGSAVKNGYISTDTRCRHELLRGYNADEFDICEPYSILSENLGPEHITVLLKCIEKNLAGHDGIIVAHGTDTLQYSAAAASYAFGLNTVPIVFVSSNYILTDARANGKSNFRHALMFIKNTRSRGTFISYKNEGECPKIHRASRVMAHAQYSDGITSLSGEYGRFEDGVFVKNPLYREHGDETEPFGIPDLTLKRAAMISAYPDMVIDAAGADAVLLETYHSGTAREGLTWETDRKIFVLGMENRMQYESVKAYRGENVTLLRKAAAPAMYIKLKMALCSGREADMNASLGGDFAD